MSPTTLLSATFSKFVSAVVSRLKVAEQLPNVQTIEARLTNFQLALIGLHASQLPSYFVAEYVRSIVRVLAGDVVHSNERVSRVCVQMLKAAPVFETKARKAEQRKLKRILARSNLPPSMAEAQTLCARRPKIERPTKREENSHMR
jgi:hypothetical protein